RNNREFLLRNAGRSIDLSNRSAVAPDLSDIPTDGFDPLDRQRAELPGLAQDEVSCLWARKVRRPAMSDGDRDVRQRCFTPYKPFEAYIHLCAECGRFGWFY